MTTAEVVVADLSNTQHSAAVLFLLNEYAKDPMGGGTELTESVKQHLIPALQARHDAHIILIFVDHKPAAIANCFEGFSTFAAKPLLNIHDFAVTPEFRGRGLTKILMNKIEEVARSLDCCKITLEVLEGNKLAQMAYSASGYAGYELDPIMGRAMFWQKKL
ncbi:MAG: GNAT family N-acetyltransferase [Gammaproteobacteria bacterium]|nr:MAG: GNAT family N-acetyltransferase [Gammaproteobacteria bacterium]